jgi:hypothetical protein
MPNRPWSEAEVELLMSFKNIRSIKIPNRSKKSVRKKLVQLGVVKQAFKIKPHNKKAWTKSEIKLLKSFSDPKSAKIPGRSSASVFKMASRLRLYKKRKYRAPWKKKNIELLKSLIKSGKTPMQIFKMGVLGPYSVNAIKKKMVDLGLSKKTIRMSYLTLVKFKDFLNNNWQGKNIKELVELWNQNNKFKVTRGRVSKSLFLMKIKVSQKDVLVEKNLRKKEEEIKSKPLNDSTIERLKLARIEVMQKRISENKDLWTGLSLN